MDEVLLWFLMLHNNVLAYSSWNSSHIFDLLCELIPETYSKMMDMSSMPTGSSTTMSNSSMPMSMEDMSMVFFHSTMTPLWSSAFTPKNAGQYAGVCIFLIALTTVFRILLALRINFFAIIDAAKRRRSGGLLEPTYKNESDPPLRPWRADETVMMAGMDVVIAGISYLLYVSVKNAKLDENADRISQDACGYDDECWLLSFDTGWCVRWEHALRSLYGQVWGALGTKTQMDHMYSVFHVFDI